jgi:hypothetical protein
LRRYRGWESARYDKSMAKQPQIDRDFGWKEIAEHWLTLRGDGEITLVTNSVLATSDTMHEPSAIGFNVTINAGSCDSIETRQYRSCHGFYGRLEDRRAALARFRAGSIDQVWMDMLGFRFGIYQLGSGTTVVEGFVSNLVPIEWYPWPMREGEITDAMLDHGPFMTCYRFAFRTSLVDPPHVDEFIHDFDELIAHLQMYAPK